MSSRYVADNSPRAIRTEMHRYGVRQASGITTLRDTEYTRIPRPWMRCRTEPSTAAWTVTIPRRAAIATLNAHMFGSG